MDRPSAWRAPCDADRSGHQHRVDSSFSSRILGSPSSADEQHSNGCDRAKLWHKYGTATRRRPVFAAYRRTTKRGPDQAFPLVRAPFQPGTPDRIRTGATALRGQGLSSTSAQVRGCLEPHGLATVAQNEVFAGAGP